MVTKEQVQALKSRVDCRDLIKQFGISFNGQNISCLNPSHPDKNPSMAVYQDHALCFACGHNLDAIGIVQNLQGLSFQEAVDHLASKFNISIPTNKKEYNYNRHNKIEHYYNVKHNHINKNLSTPKISDSSIKNLMWEIIKPLEPTREAIEWLSKRKISVKTAWNLGCRDITPIIKRIEELIENTPQELLKENHLLNGKGDIWFPILNKIKGYTDYSGLIIPIFNPNSEIHCFRWRLFNSIKRENKTIKVLSQPSCELLPIGLNYAKNLENKDSIYICEGEPDWLSLNTLFYEKNYKNKIAIGLCVLSNTWKKEWTEIIAKFKSIYICLHDTDKAIKVTEKIAFSLLQEDPKGLEYWGNHFFRKLFSEKNDANDMLINNNLLNNLPL